jgi:predicted MFS family arabinose efflux permease
MLLGGWMVASYGWRAFFIVTGGVTLLWLIPWFMYMPPNPGRSLRGGPGYLRILGRREAWASFLGLFCHNYNWYLLLTWLPTYLQRERGFSPMTMTIYSTLPMIATALATLAAGAWADRLIRAGAPAARTRRNVMIAGMLIAASCLPVATVHNHVLAMTMLTIAFIGVGIYASNCWALAQCLAGPQSAGRWTGLQNCIGNLSGVVAPIVTGYLVQQTKLYWTAFITSSTVLVIGVLILYFFLHDPAPVDWEKA